MIEVHIFVLSRRSLLISLALLFLTLGTLFIIMQRSAAPSLSRAPGTYYMSHTEEKVVALTFDDGPDPVDTPAVLDILKEKNVTATFFVLGQAAHDYPDLLKRMVQEGHEIGNHSFTHDYQQRRLAEEIRQTDRDVFAATDLHTYFYRPPGGFISDWQLEIIKKTDHVVALWSVDSKDWRNPGVNQILDNVLNNVFPGAIILLHDGGYQRTQTVKALEPLINALQERGYRFTTLSELKQIDSELNIN